MTLVAVTQPPSVAIRFGVPEDEAGAGALWQDTGARAVPEGAPAARLVASDPRTGRLLGVAEYFRAFPPEDAIGAVAVLPSERRRGVGTALLQALARHALRQGKRNLAGFVPEDDVAAWNLLHSADIPLRVYDIDGGFYVELDLVSLMREPSEQRPQPLVVRESVAPY